MSAKDGSDVWVIGSSSFQSNGFRTSQKNIIDPTVTNCRESQQLIFGMEDTHGQRFSSEPRLTQFDKYRHPRLGIRGYSWL